MSSVKKGINDLATWCKDNNKEYILQEWDTIANAPLSPDEVSRSSCKKYHWICSVCNNHYMAPCGSRIKGSGCRLCGLKKGAYTKEEKRRTTGNTLDILFPNILVDWAYDINEKEPSSYSPYSCKKVTWRCHICNTVWIAGISNRTRRGAQCPGCTGRVAIPGKTDVFTTNPSMRDFYDEINNVSLKPQFLLPSSKEKAYWKCAFCNASFMATFSSISKGRKYCDSCSKRFRTSFPEQAIYYYIQQEFPDAISGDRRFKSELDIYIPSKNIAIEYDGQAWHSDSKSIAKDLRKNEICLSHNIQLFRIRESECPKLTPTPNCIIIECVSNSEKTLSEAINTLLQQLGVNRVVSVSDDQIKILESFKISVKRNSISAILPELVPEYHPTKNGALTVEQLYAHSNTKVWWVCPNGHADYQTSPNSRSKGCGCSICGKNKAIKTVAKSTRLRNGLFIEECKGLQDEIDRDYLSERKIDISLLQARDDKIILKWKCRKCGYMWLATAYRRFVKKNGCPSCNHASGLRKWHKEKMHKSNTSLKAKYPQIASELHPTKNGNLTADQIAYGSSDKNIWWLCPVCGNEYQTSPNARTNSKSSTGCKKCGLKRRVELAHKRVMNIETGQIFESVLEANKWLGKKNTNVSAVCRGERNVANGYHWKYVDE